jgi:hypothetical protein
MLENDTLGAVLALTGLSYPTEFVEALRAYGNRDRLRRLGLLASHRDIVQLAKLPFPGEGFLPFIESNSNVFLVGCGPRFRGVIAAYGVVLTGKLGGLTHECVEGFTNMLDATKNNEDADCIELLASGDVYDVIRAETIVAEADQKVTGLLAKDPSAATWYMTAASGALCIRLLEADNFFIQEAAAWRLGRLGETSAIEPLARLARTVVPPRHVDQHIRAAKQALAKIRRRTVP